MRRFELHLIESGEGICNRDRVITEYDSCSASRSVATLSAGYSRPPHVPFAFTQLSRRPTVRLNTRRPGLLSGSRMK